MGSTNLHLAAIHFHCHAAVWCYTHRCFICAFSLCYSTSLQLNLARLVIDLRARWFLELHLLTVCVPTHGLQACLAMEVWNNQTGELLCRQEPVYGGNYYATAPQRLYRGYGHPD